MTSWGGFSSWARTFAVALCLGLTLSLGLAAVTTPALADDAQARATAREKRAKNAPAPALVPFVVRQVAVECNGSCSDSSLATLCQTGWRPIAVDCNNAQEWSGTNCGGNNVCARFPVLTTDTLGDYCDDTSGWDANVYCAQ